MKLLLSPMKVLFPLKPYLWQLVSHSTTERVYNPYQYWCSHRRAHLERCWNWKKEWAEKLERCWQQPWNPDRPLSQSRDPTFPPKQLPQKSDNRLPTGDCPHHQLMIQLKWRGVAYFRPVVNAGVNPADVTQPVTRSVDESKGLGKDSDCQPSPRSRPSQTSQQT